METAQGSFTFRVTTQESRSGTRSLAAAAISLAGLLVLSVGLTDGGYSGRTSSALTAVFAAVALLGALAGLRPRLGIAGISTFASLGLLLVWIALSSLWARPGAAVEPEVRRCALYLVAFAAIAAVVDLSRRLAFLGGLLGAICCLGVFAISMRVLSGPPADRFYGSLLAEPVGYPNALGVIAAMGIVLAVGLAHVASGGWAAACGAAASLLVLVLGLSGSRGGALALGIGVLVLIGLTPAAGRRALGTAIGFSLAVGGIAWIVVQWSGAEGLALAALAVAACVAGCTAVRWWAAIDGRVLRLVACAALVGLVVVLAARPPAMSSSYRSAYWQAAAAELGEHSALGAGAGSFFLTWREHRTVQLDVRDAHSLYLETLSELGPIGLVLVIVLVSVPLAAGARRRGDPVVAAAAATFAVYVAHAGIDWDWEMPVVTLIALGCAGAVLAGDRLNSEPQQKGESP